MLIIIFERCFKNIMIMRIIHIWNIGTVIPGKIKISLFFFNDDRTLSFCKEPIGYAIIICTENNSIFSFAIQRKLCTLIIHISFFVVKRANGILYISGLYGEDFHPIAQ